MTSTTPVPSAASTRMLAAAASLWRRTLVTPSRTAQRQDGVHRRRQALGAGSTSAAIPAAASADRAAASSHRERRLAVAADRLAHGRQRLARDPLDVRDLGRGPLRSVGSSAPRELALEGDDRQAVAEGVVEVARDPVALLGDGQRRELLARRPELRFARPQRGQREHREPDDRRR